MADSGTQWPAARHRNPAEPPRPAPAPAVGRPVNSAVVAPDGHLYSDQRSLKNASQSVIDAARAACGQLAAAAGLNRFVLDGVVETDFGSGNRMQPDVAARPDTPEG